MGLVLRAEFGMPCRLGASAKRGLELGRMEISADSSRPLPPGLSPGITCRDYSRRSETSQAASQAPLAPLRLQRSYLGERYFGPMTNPSSRGCPERCLGCPGLNWFKAKVD